LNSSKKATSDSSEPVPVFDLAQDSYPKIEEGFEETVKYIPLETRDDVLISERRRVIYYSDNRIVMTNEDSDVFIFDGSGKIVSHFNRRGEGPQEYLTLRMLLNGSTVVYDEPNREIFVMESIGRCNVYSEDGKYLRTFRYPKSKQYREAYSFDKESLLAIDYNIDTDSVYVFLSKKDGSVLSCIDIPLQKRIPTTHQRPMGEGGVFSASITTQQLLKDGDDFILAELSSDTIYRFTSDKRLIPILAMTPSKQQDNEKYIFFQPLKVTEKYVFGYKYVFDFSQIKETDPPRGFKTVNLIYDMEKRQAFNSSNSPDMDYYVQHITREVYYTDLPANLFVRNGFPDGILRDLEKGEVEGKLKEVAEKLDPDDNPVIQVIKFK
jgi:hypothetical protein